MTLIGDCTLANHAHDGTTLTCTECNSNFALHSDNSDECTEYPGSSDPGYIADCTEYTNTNGDAANWKCKACGNGKVLH